MAHKKKKNYSQQKEKIVLHWISVGERKQVRVEVKWAIKKAKAAYKKKKEQKFKQSNLQVASQRIKTTAALNSLRDFTPLCMAGSTNESLINDLNSFYVRFEPYTTAQLRGVFQQVFQSPLAIVTVPQSWKPSIIIPISKMNSHTVQKYLRPIAHTSLVMKTFKSIVRSHITKARATQMDPVEFVYCAKRGVKHCL